MTEKKLTIDVAVKLAEEVIRGKEDYIYINPRGEPARGFTASSVDPLPKCYNWDIERDQPSCVVGHIFHKFGIPVAALINHNEEGVGNFPEFFDDSIDGDRAYQFLTELQSSQDKGRPWGESLARAKREVEWTS